METSSGAASSSGLHLTRRRLREKRPAPEGQRDDGKPRTKEARTEEDATISYLAVMVAEAVDYTGKALDTVNDAMHGIPRIQGFPK